MRVIIDRFEGEMAVVELPDGTVTQMPRLLVPDAAEGDVVNVTVDPKERQKREETIQSLMDDLFGD
ncbi:MAG: DUF3006 domain-containing protein [Clostridia bacterium]|nr:DUF3006 domain-containing protein [Clostridia bacterium]